MTFNKSLMTATLLTVAGLTAVSSANAVEPNPAISSFGVSMDVDPICTIAVPPTKVGLADTQAGKGITTVVQSQTTLTLNCSTGALAVISLTPASTGTGDGLGEMKGPGETGTEKVAYKLTTNAAGDAAWGNTTGGASYAAPVATKYATDISTIIYVTVTDDADVTPGAYTDVVNVSVAY